MKRALSQKSPIMFSPRDPSSLPKLLNKFRQFIELARARDVIRYDTYVTRPYYLQIPSICLKKHTGTGCVQDTIPGHIIL